MKKKCIMLLLAMALTISNVSPIPVAAAEEAVLEDSFTITDIVEEDIEISNTVKGEYYDGVSPYSPENLPVARDTSPPPKSKVKDISVKKYDFSGSSNHKKLYTNYNFKGKSKYTVKISNHGSKAIVVKALRKGKTYAMLRVGKGKSVTFNVTDIYKTTLFYLVFDGEGNSYEFSGYIK